MRKVDNKDCEKYLNHGYRSRNLSAVHKFKIKGTDGQASLEFALIIPLLVIIVLIVSQLGYLVYVQNVLVQAAREGARVISTTNSNQMAFNRIGQICSRLDKDRLKIKIDPGSSTGREVGDVVNVNLSYKYSGVTNLINLLIGRDIFINTDSSMRMECY